MEDIEIGDKVILSKTDSTKYRFGYYKDTMLPVGSVCTVEEFDFGDEGIYLEGCEYVYHVEDFVKGNK